MMLTGQVSTRSAAEQMPKVLSSYSDPTASTLCVLRQATKPL